jgi:uncharacterized membrane protein YsdA (DUF1294 family)
MLTPVTLSVATLIMSLVTFAAFGLDKGKAKRGRWRIPEATLLLLAFLLGAPGAFLGMSFFRHKTQKVSFKAKLVVVGIFNPLWVLAYLAVRAS